MRIAIVGAGAIGGWIGARLAATGHDVTLLARGETLQALRTGGLSLSSTNQSITVHPDVTDAPDKIDPCDLVFVAVKGPALGRLASAVARLAKPEGAIIPMINGVPWWFLGREEPLCSVDPDGSISAAIPEDRIVACVVHAAAARTAPNEVKLVHCDRLIFGEPTGGLSPRVKDLVAVLDASGLPAVTSANIRADIWFKLWGNMTINPISALTLATADRILDDPQVLGFVTEIMEEARAIGDRIGCPISQSTSDRTAVTRQLGAFRTSMLQDVEACRVLEIDALLGAPREIASRLGMRTPALDALYGLTRLMAQSRGLC